MQLFIQKQVEKDSSLITFDKTESRHLAKVLRKKEGDIIHVTNGLGVLFTCELEMVNNNQCIARILETKHEEPRRSEEHTSELQSRFDLVCRLLLEKKKKRKKCPK